MPISSRTLESGRSARYASSSGAAAVPPSLEEPREQLLAQAPIGSVELRHEAALEPRAQPLLQPVDRLRRDVAREHELLARRVEVVEDVEELFLRALLARHELHVVDQQCVGRAVARTEPLDLSFLQRGDELVDEQLRTDARHARRLAVAARASSLPIAFSRCVFPTPLGPAMNSGL